MKKKNKKQKQKILIQEHIFLFK